MSTPVARMRFPRAGVGDTHSLHRRVYSSLKAMILGGELEDGRAYSPAELAPTFRASASSVKKALQQLSTEGLVHAEQAESFRVVQYTAKQLNDLFDVRLLLEVHAMESVAALSPRPESAFARARQIYDEMQAFADRGHLADYLRSDREFHLLLASLAGNTLLTNLLAELRDHMHLPGILRLARRGHLERSSVEHLELLVALAAGDVAAARTISARHVRRTRAEWSSGEVDQEGQSSGPALSGRRQLATADAAIERSRDAANPKGGPANG